MTNELPTRQAVNTFKMNVLDKFARFFEYMGDYFSDKWYVEFMKYNSLTKEEQIAIAKHHYSDDNCRCGSATISIDCPRHRHLHKDFDTDEYDC